MASVDPEAKRAALTLLARGMLTIAEAREHAGVSRQLMQHWVKCAGIDWQRIRRTRRAVWWRKEIGRGKSQLGTRTKSRPDEPCAAGRDR